MSKFIIKGGKKLEGEIDVRGSKNAALPILAATLLIDKPCRIENLPLIGDVFTMLKILQSMGSKQEWLGERAVLIKNDDIDPEKLDQSLVRLIRASVLLAGPILARFKKAVLAVPGGCHIGLRPLDAHLEAFRDAGADIEYDPDAALYHLRLRELKPASVTLKEQSVTATENIMMFFALADGTSEIKMAAAEPHVQDLGRFLVKLGAEVGGLNSNDLTIKGRRFLRPADFVHKIIPDYIEAGTYLVLAAAAGKKILIKNFPSAHLEAVLKKAGDFGVVYESGEDSLLVSSSPLKAARIKTQVYPGFPTDLQSPFGALATRAVGESLIFDTLYEGRLKYIDELKKMGAKAVILDNHKALIFGPTPLHGAEIKTLDLRAGAVMAIAALIAEGKSILYDVEVIDRGYERLEERLQNLGAHIFRTA